jgi:hypothetical protein
MLLFKYFERKFAIIFHCEYSLKLVSLSVINVLPLELDLLASFRGTPISLKQYIADLINISYNYKYILF